ncbi:MAG: ABC transporter ATP-binding protein [Defluviitaleaceae bacterium]|nr:ABC transporter ATP-binding protein [Defluviitaleaceae bacterium]MCL2835962.1 ABC transporter ATP-binding protein [Defluviitaleaceae bacterium]
MTISMQNVGKTYKGGKKALDNVTMDFTSPNMIGLVGPNGAGKTTLMKLLAAALLPTAGGITLDGKPLNNNEKYLKSVLGYLPQTFGLYDELTVWQFLDYMAALKGIKKPREAIAKAINETNLGDRKKTKIRSLSGGMKQRVGIAQALIGDPRLIILDEPTVGLDPEERINFRNLFSHNARDKIVLLSTHIIEDVQSICNRLIVMNHGSILFDGGPDELIQAAHGHVGICEQNGGNTAGYQITSRINTARGVICRIIAEKLPYFAEPAEPTLEDAYMYLIEKGSE